MITVSFRFTPQLAELFDRAIKHRPNTRVAIATEAVQFAAENLPDYQMLYKEVKKIKPSNKDDSLPAYIQLRLQKDKWVRVNSDVCNSFSPPLKKTTSALVLRLVLLNYVKYLEANNSEEKAFVTENTQDDFYSRSIEEKLNIIYDLLKEMKGGSL